jgi:catechol 2,3-dioxygenase-like lactoylglutathione lyase family enzyme
MRLDGVRCCLSDAPAAVEAYETFFGFAPRATAGGGWRFQLERGAVEVIAAGGVPPHLAVTFAAEDGDDLVTWPTDAGEHGGIDVLVLSDTSSERPPPAAAEIAAIDHVVVRTADPARAVAHWRDRLGLRLALDQTFPERHLRLLFFRSGGITLEYAHALDQAPAGGDDLVYGVSYRVGDVAAVRARLLGAGCDVSEIRPGMKPGSAVATVRSGTAGVPTLLIQQPPRA